MVLASVAAAACAAIPMSDVLTSSPVKEIVATFKEAFPFGMSHNRKIILDVAQSILGRASSESLALKYNMLSSFHFYILASIFILALTLVLNVLPPHAFGVPRDFEGQSVVHWFTR